MANQINESPKNAALNEQWFSAQAQGELVEGSPHLKHREVGTLALTEARHLFQQVRQHQEVPAVLDMGAGEGMLTVPFLEMGASVTAADATPPLLEVLEQRAAKFKSRLTLAPGDIFETLHALSASKRQFDIVCASSFLHHIPDYLKLCRLAAGLIRPGGAFFTFQDPLRYDTLGRGTFFFDRISYFGWRLLQGNYGRGLKTRLRRIRGTYRDDLPEDVAEYHVVRSGVDQGAIREFFLHENFDCEIRKYWSTQSTFFQQVGSKLGLVNTFAVVATKPA
jgi:SAM-dependent methyltransferase